MNEPQSNIPPLPHPHPDPIGDAVNAAPAGVVLHAKRGGIQFGEVSAPPPVRIEPRATLAHQMLAEIESAHRLGSQHLDPNRRDHSGAPVPGCPWCVDQERAVTLHARLTERWPDEPTLTVYEARVLCARGDLARSES